MRRLKAAGIIITAILLSGSVVVTAYSLSGRFLAAITPSNGVATCQAKHANHRVIIEGDTANPQHTQGTLCDTLTITNKDNVIRLIAFGPHEHHQPYDGVTEKLLGAEQSLTITLNQAGTYHFHDHVHDEVTGDFTVNR